MNEDAAEGASSPIAFAVARMTPAMAGAGAVIIPVGLTLSGIFAGWKGLAGSFVGFGLVALNAVAALATVRWALGKPASFMPVLLLSTMWGRLLVLAGALFGLRYVKALEPLAMLLSFLALFVAYTGIEVVYAYRAFGASPRPLRRP